MQITSLETVSIFGHSPESTTNWTANSVQELTNLIVCQLQCVSNLTRVKIASGRGFGEAAILACIKLQVPFDLLIPFIGKQAESFIASCTAPAENIILNTGTIELGYKLAKGCTQAITFWNGTKSGRTWQYIRQLEAEQVPTINCHRFLPL